MLGGGSCAPTLYNHLQPSRVTFSVHPAGTTMLRGCCLLLLAAVCLGQRQGDRQIRLEDIERDNLAASQKAAAPAQQPSQHTQQQQTLAQQHQALTQQQLAAYQQQLLLQQLQQQYFAPSPLSYPNFGVPLMIIPGNHLGSGSAGVPIQAFFVPTDSQYLPQYQPVYRYQQQRVAALPAQDLSFNSAYQRFPASVVIPAPKTYQQSPSYQQAQAYQPATQSYQPQASYQQHYQPQQTQQQLYNAYNALYQQQQDKSSFAAGVKSTPAPPLKPQSQAYQQPAQAYSNYKTFNYNQ